MSLLGHRNSGLSGPSNVAVRETNPIKGHLSVLVTVKLFNYILYIF